MASIRSRLPLVLAGLAVFAALTLVTLLAPATTEAQRKKILNIAAKEPEGLDPHSSLTGQSQSIHRFFFRGLTRFAIKDGKVTTGLTRASPDRLLQLLSWWTILPPTLSVGTGVV